MCAPTHTSLLSQNPSLELKRNEVAVRERAAAAAAATIATLAASATSDASIYPSWCRC
jgi:hypothetical protein